MRNLHILFIALFIMVGCKSTENYKIKGKLKSCHESLTRFDDDIFLYKDGNVIDSANTELRSFLSVSIKKKRFKFKNVEPGNYLLKYNPRFKFDSTKSVSVLDRSIKVEICMAEIPQKAFLEGTLLDKLENNDTLYISAYIASAGEFGGYDEGLWIWKTNGKYKWQIYDLSSSYHLGWDADLTEFYKQNKNKAKPKTDILDLSDTDIQNVNTFLVESRYYLYKNETGVTNGPDHISVYSNHYGFYYQIHDWEWKAYEKLIKKINTAGNSGA